MSWQERETWIDCNQVLDSLGFHFLDVFCVEHVLSRFTCYRPLVPLEYRHACTYGRFQELSVIEIEANIKLNGKIPANGTKRGE